MTHRIQNHTHGRWGGALHRSATLSLASACLMIGQLAHTQTMTVAKPPRTPALLARLHEVNLLAIRAGHMAEDRGRSPLIRAFGARLVRDHVYADRKVLALAQAEHITLNTKSSASQAANRHLFVDRLAEASGRDFDQEFLTEMVRTQRDDVQLLSQTASWTSDRRVRRLLTKLVPIFEQHLQVAKNLRNRRNLS